ncbi:acyltransferase family protein [Chitinophaga sancti]|uniref:acyltransferase family protein n=1 Tax=Chitinophaga sancti TaxID=1004 RepID=UPI003F7AD48D
MKDNQRLQSLDALRGFDMFWIMSGEHIIHALAKATKWGPVEWMSAQLNHTEWNGFTFYDMIFPLFLFIAGVTMPLSLQKKMEVAGVKYTYLLPGEEKRKLYMVMLKRALILVVLGFIVNGLLKFNGLENTRFPSVLGRIGLAWFFAGLISLNFSVKGQVYWLLGILLGYWALMMWVPVPGYGAGVLTMDGSLESYIDRVLVPGRLHDKVHDPEGVLSTLPAIGTALLGTLVGTFIQRGVQTPLRKGIMILGFGAVLVLLGYVWDFGFPINKRLWTSSFVLYAGGFSVMFLSAFYLIIDVWGFRKWAFPFVIIGTNSILIYMAAEGMVDFKYTAGFVFNGVIQYAPLLWQPVFAAVSVTFVQLCLLYVCYKNKLFLKI